MLIRHGLLGSLKGGFAATWAVVFVIVPITSHRRSVAILRVSLVLRTSLLFEFCVLLHQLLAIRCPSSDLLNHDHWICRRWWSENVYMSQGTLLIEIRWLARNNCNSIISHRRCQTNEAENCHSSVWSTYLYQRNNVRGHLGSWGSLRCLSQFISLKNITK